MSSAIDDDTKQKVARGRATLGSLLANARDDLRKAFIVFVVGFLGTFYVLRLYVWDRLKADLNTNPDINIIAVTPFDVILLQVKIGMIVGILITVPVVVYYGRDALRARGWWPADDVPRWKLVLPALLSTALFLGGIAYAYFLFFPLMLDFLAGNAVNAGFEPNWSIVKWTQFVAFLSLSFGLAAQLPLTMSGLAYLRIVSYQTFRNKWRHAVVGIFAFGAFFSPPDPFTQLMWATPLVGLYVFSLGLSRLAELTRRSSEELSLPAVARSNWNVLAGAGVAVFGAVYLFLTRGGVAALDRGLASLPDRFAPGPLPGLGTALGLETRVAAGLVAAVVTALVLAVVVFVFAVRDLGDSPPPGTGTSPADIDLLTLDDTAIRVTPPEAFEEMDEEEALRLASEAMEDQDDPEKAQAILDRWDEVQNQEVDGDDVTPGASDDAPADDEADADGDADADAGVFTSTTAGVVDAFTEEETTEEDVGGYYYDIAFIVESITSRAFRLVAVFMVVMGATFVYLYRGGIGDIKATFLDRMPPSMTDQVAIVTLHPVEALIFEIKFATLLGIVATLPLVCYYAWPRLKERRIVGGDRRVILVWGVTLVVGVVVGSLFGFLYVAPTIISWLATDAVTSSMVISYRINTFGWLVVFTTVGVGLLVEIPVTMFLFHQGRLVPFETMRERWRGVVMAIVAGSAVFTPSSLLTMIVLAVPTAFAFLAGLGLLWMYTLGGRRTVSRESKAAD